MQWYAVYHGVVQCDEGFSEAPERQNMCVMFYGEIGWVIDGTNELLYYIDV